MGVIKFFGSTGISGLATPTVSMFGNLSGSRKYAGGALGINGKIYCPPRQATRVLEIDPFNKVAVEIGGAISGTNDKYTGAVAYPNGKIYAIPRNIHPVLEIDPLNGTSTPVGTVWQIAGQWWGGILHPNGKIYGVPSSRNTFLEFDPILGDGILVGLVSGRYLGAVLGVNEKIYCFPQDNNGSILEFDPHTYSVRYFSSIPGGTFGGILDLEGHLSLITQSRRYMQIDYVSGNVIKNFYLGDETNTGISMFPSGIICRIGAGANSMVINPKTGKFKKFDLGSSDSYYGSVMGQNGKIYGVPFGANQVVELEYPGTVTADMYTIPPLHQLALSLYNRYQNKF